MGSPGGESKDLAFVADGLTSAQYAEYEEYGPWGSFGSALGESAIFMLQELVEPKIESRLQGGEPVKWDRSDRKAFAMLNDLEGNIGFIEPAPDPVVSGNDIYRLFQEFGRLHAALPFSEAERVWLLRKSSDEWPDGLIGEAAEIMSNGVRQVVRGRELVRRWWAWRRETDEFVGQGSLDEARQALGVLAETLVIESKRPEYPDIRARLQDLAGESADSERPRSER
jgi:hypothetical protein